MKYQGMMKKEIRSRICHIFDMIMLDDEKGKAEEEGIPGFSE